MADRPPGTIIIQPENRDPLPGIFLSLAKIQAKDPNATVIIYPSDHFIYPEKNFIGVIASAVQAAEELSNTLVPVGVPASRLELEYGWITPGAEIWRTGAHSVRSVRHFIEKPFRAEAAELKASGGVWNALIVAVRANMLWQLGLEYFPEIMSLFTRFKNAIGTSCERAVLDEIYKIMPLRNFSRGLLTPAVSQIGVMLMKHVLRSDWGCEEKKPSFPMVALSIKRQTLTL